MLETMIWLTAAWESASPIILVNCFRKAGISSESQVRRQSDDDDLFKLLTAQLAQFQEWCECPIDFTVDGSVDADEYVVISEAHLPTDSEIMLKLVKRSLMQQKMMTKMRKMV